jgi:hypothetical protein
MRNPNITAITNFMLERTKNVITVSLEVQINDTGSVGGQPRYCSIGFAPYKVSRAWLRGFIGSTYVLKPTTNGSVIHSVIQLSLAVLSAHIKACFQ